MYGFIYIRLKNMSYNRENIVLLLFFIFKKEDLQ